MTREQAFAAGTRLGQIAGLAALVLLVMFAAAAFATLVIATAMLAHIGWDLIR